MFSQKLYKSKNNSILFGVLGGLSEYFKVDPVLCRVLFVIAVVMLDTLSGVFILVYIVLAFVMPEKPVDYSDQPLDHSHYNQTPKQPIDVDEMDEEEWSNF